MKLLTRLQSRRVSRPRKQVLCCHAYLDCALCIVDGHLARLALKLALGRVAVIILQEGPRVLQGTEYKVADASLQARTERCLAAELGYRKDKED